MRFPRYGLSKCNDGKAVETTYTKTLGEDPAMKIIQMNITERTSLMSLLDSFSDPVIDPLTIRLSLNLVMRKMVPITITIKQMRLGIENEASKEATTILGLKML